MIQFGHNDEKTNVEGTGSTIPEFESNLKMFVSETKVAGGVPVLFTPVVRCNFSGNKISETGRHITTEIMPLLFARLLQKPELLSSIIPS